MTLIANPAAELDEAGDATPPPRTRWLRRGLVVAAAAIVGVVLISVVMPGRSQPNERSAPTGRTARSAGPTTTVRQADTVLIAYAQAMRTWTACHSTSGDGCGAAPVQPKDSRLDQYVADVGRWSTCATPLLKRNAPALAVQSCGLPPDPAQAPYSLPGISPRDLGLPDPAAYR